MTADLHSISRYRLPESYIKFMATHIGFEGGLGSDFGYCVIWSADKVISAYTDYQMATYLDPTHYAFGSDGGDEMLVFDLSQSGDRVLRLPFIGMSAEDSLELCESFSDLALAISLRRPA